MVVADAVVAALAVAREEAVAEAMPEQDVKAAAAETEEAEAEDVKAAEAALVVVSEISQEEAAKTEAAAVPADVMAEATENADHNHKLYPIKKLPADDLPGAFFVMTQFNCSVKRRISICGECFS